MEVEELEEFEEREEEEFDRWEPLRRINIRGTSSALIEVRAPCPPSSVGYHPRRGADCTLGGDATAVMERVYLFLGWVRASFGQREREGGKEWERVLCLCQP